MEALLAEKQGDRTQMESVLNAFRTKLEAEVRFDRREGGDERTHYFFRAIRNTALNYVECLTVSTAKTKGVDGAGPLVRLDSSTSLPTIDEHRQVMESSNRRPDDLSGDVRDKP